MLEEIGFIDVTIGPPVDTFEGAGGEKNARRFEVYGYPFLARKPWLRQRCRRATAAHAATSVGPLPLRDGSSLEIRDTCFRG
jgi:hypothetical protein